MRRRIGELAAGEAALDFARKLQLGPAAGAQVFVGFQQPVAQVVRQRLHAFLRRGGRAGTKPARRKEQRTHLIPRRCGGRVAVVFGHGQLVNRQRRFLVAGERRVEAGGEGIGAFALLQRLLVGFLLRQTTQLAVHAHPHRRGGVGDFQRSRPAERKLVVEPACARLVIAAQNVGDRTVFGQAGGERDMSPADKDIQRLVVQRGAKPQRKGNVQLFGEPQIGLHGRVVVLETRVERARRRQAERAFSIRMRTAPCGSSVSGAIV